MGINVLSLFDGMSCGQIALDRAGIKVDNYFASEIDPHAIRVTQANFPNTIQLGDVTKIKASDLPKIDLIIGGSPCQGFSFAGKQLNFEDPRSKLFFEFVRLLQETEAPNFLLENVRMKQEHQDVISEYLGVEPTEINSQFFSAQDRKRLYWTNLKILPFTHMEGPALAEVLDEITDDSLYLNDEITSRYFRNPNFKLVTSKSCVVGKLSKYQGDRVFHTSGKASSLSASGGNNGGGGCNILFDPKTSKLRKLSVSECCRLQNVSPDYAKVITNSQMYKVLGNGWTVGVITHIFRSLPYAKN